VPLILYNAFPRSYSNIVELIDHLQEIKRMGFNSVWINPFQRCRENDSSLFEKSDKVSGIKDKNWMTGSIYAMTDESRIASFWSTNDKDTDVQQVQALTAEAKRLGLCMMFDLVLNHVASNAEIVQQHPEWFHAPKPPFIDAAEFNLEKESIRREIIENFWKPYIYKYIVEYGFTGIRVDAVGHADPELQAELLEYANGLSIKHHGKKITTLGELLFSGSGADNPIHKLTDAGASYTYITNSIYYGDSSSFDGAIQSLPDWSNSEMGEKRPLSLLGTIGFSGNHDETTLLMSMLMRLAFSELKDKREMVDDWKTNAMKAYPIVQSYLEKINADIKDEAFFLMINKMMKEHLATVAFASCGGYYLLCGDEYGSPHSKGVFEREDGSPVYESGGGPQGQFGGVVNITDFVRGVNSTLEMLSEPESMYWYEIFYPGHAYDPDRDLRVIIRHNVKSPPHNVEVVIANTGDQCHEVTLELLQDVCMQSRALREASIDASKVKVHFVGNVTSSLHLAHNEVARSPLPILASYDKDTPSVSGGTSVEVAATQPGYKPGGS
jgi:glycosidase